MSYPMNATIMPQANMPSDALKAAELKVQIETEGDHFHPLEGFKFFRRWPRSFARNFVYTLILNIMFGVFFTLLGLFSVIINSKPVRWDGLWSNIGTNLVIANAIGFSFWAVMSGLGPVMRKINRRSFVEVALFYSILGMFIVTGAFVGLSYLPGFRGMQAWVLTPTQLMSSFTISFVISLVFATIWRRRVGELSAQIALANEQERFAAAERATTQANLRALQAQIEPHFLFNTLANVTSLIHTKPDDAKHMLEEFIAYLRASLATTREAETTLGNEFQLMQNFLAILQIRMGARLQTKIDLPDTLQQFSMPPMLIQPMVENAIKHGLEPKIEGGTVSLSAYERDGMVHIVIADTGLGFRDSKSNGIGLQNVRERVDKIYNGRATLSIEENTPCGTRITIAIPKA
jgi:sensor histidine kinase YesM